MSIANFSSSRMVSDYFSGSYSPALANYDRLSGDGFQSIRADIARRNDLFAKWDSVRVEAVEADRDLGRNVVGDSFEVSAKVRLEGVDPADVRVELYLGRPDAQGHVSGGVALPMEQAKRLSQSLYLFKRTVECASTGAFAFTARVVPASDPWRTSMPDYVRWA